MGSSKSSQGRAAWQEFSDRSTNPATSRPDVPPAQQQLKVQTSRQGRKGKTVTIISGFQAKPETLAELTKTLKGYCGAGGTVKDSTIEIQGDHRQKVQQWLTSMGYKVKVIGN